MVDYLVGLLAPALLVIGTLGFLMSAGLIVSDRRRWLGSNKRTPRGPDPAAKDPAATGRDTGASR